jgi:ABC-type multidrug transport system fused ATPase/permease subunit
MFFSKNSIYNLYKNLWAHISLRRRFQLLLLLILMIIVSFAEMFSISSILPFLGALTSPEKLYNQNFIKPLFIFLNIKSPDRILFPITIIFIFATLFSGIMRILLLWAQTKYCHGVGSEFSYNIYRRTLYQSYQTHLSRNSSEIISGITNKANLLISSAMVPLLTIISSILILLMILFTMFYVDKIIAIESIIGFLLIYIIIIRLSKSQIEKDSKIINLQVTNIVKTLQEGLGGIRDVIIDNLHEYFCKIYSESDIPLRKAQANYAIINSVPRFAIETLGMILIAFFAYNLAMRPEGLSTAIPILGTFAIAAQKLLPILQNIFQSWTNIKNGEESINNSIALLDQKIPDYINETIPLNFHHHISINNLSFKYSDGPTILNNLNLIITKGSRTGFIGSTGSGKSTLLDIIMGLLEPTEGYLAIDNYKLKNNNIRHWQNKIAHVPQSIYLADTTIAENIAFGIPISDINFERLYKAAEKAQIHNTINGLEDKYFTKVGERGVRLSGGQRQRIGIARALYKQADILVFDEATSALDNKTEQNIIDSIDSLDQNLTIIIVAHRITTLKSCSQIIELEYGKIKNIGKYSDIISQYNF